MRSRNDFRVFGAPRTRIDDTVAGNVELSWICDASVSTSANCSSTNLIDPGKAGIQKSLPAHSAASGSSHIVHTPVHSSPYPSLPGASGPRPSGVCRRSRAGSWVSKWTTTLLQIKPMPQSHSHHLRSPGDLPLELNEQRFDFPKNWSTMPQLCQDRRLQTPISALSLCPGMATALIPPVNNTSTTTLLSFPL